jgi:hypothetical protein
LTYDNGRPIVPDFIAFWRTMGYVGAVIDLGILVAILALGRRPGRWRAVLIVGAAMRITGAVYLALWSADMLFASTIARYAVWVTPVFGVLSPVLILIGIVGMANDLHRLRLVATAPTQVFSDFPVPPAEPTAAASSPPLGWPTDLVPPV